jgi:hypothetical protein
MTQEQEDYLSGRLESQRLRALEAKKVRTFLITHPLSSAADIRKGTGIERPGKALRWLIIRGLVRCTSSGYEVIPL